MIAPPLLASQRVMAHQGIRRLLVISGEADWCQQQAQMLIKSLAGDWQWVSERDITQEEVISASAVKTLLGQEILHAVFDATIGLNIEALIVLAGTLRAGSWLLLLVPPWRCWAIQPDKDSLRWSESDAAIITPHFIRHFQRQLLADSEVAFWQQGQHPVIPVVMTRPAWQLPEGAPTLRQQAILQQLMRAEAGAWVLTAARGRGKSTLAGMLVAQWPGMCWITGPSKSATEKLRQQADKQAVFWAPDALLNYCREHDVSQIDWLLIDEAAAIPMPLLAALSGYFPRVLLTTTVQGYEGTGRGFLLKFCATLSDWHNLTLTEPIRWAANDPLERVLDHALLFNDAPQVGGLSTKTKIMRYKQHEWLAKPHLLHRFYSLLSSAHYCTTPLDLRRLMDAPGMHFAATMADEAVIGALWLVDEGGLSRELAREVWAGRRRPRGNLVAQSLAAHSGLWLAPTLRSRRVSRVAVATAWRRQGIALQMILVEKKSARQQNLDYLSVSFGYTAELNSFWQACGFKLMRIGSHKEASSGCYAAMAILPLSAAAEILCQSAQQQLARDWHWLQAWRECCLMIINHDDGCLNDDDWRELAGFAYAFRSLETSLAALQRLLNNSPLALPALRQYLQQRRAPKEIIQRLGLSGRKTLMACWRQEVQQALVVLDDANRAIWQAWVMG